jgi:hypothetical protein
MFKLSYFAANYWTVKTIGGGAVGTAVPVDPVYDTSGRGGFNRGQGGPGSSYGVGCSTLTTCPICNCMRCCPT